jgi:polyisoprenoid-binding protein YceI
MKSTALSVATAALLFSASAHAESVPWTIDPMHSQIGFTAHHLGFAKVHGEFKKFSAKIEADAKTGKISKLEARPRPSQSIPVSRSATTICAPMTSSAPINSRP